MAQLSIWDTTEISVTIIAASIPALRVLVRDVASTSKRYYLQRHTGNDDFTASRAASKPHHSVTVKSDRFERRDDQSDTEILESSRGKIYRVDEIEIEHSQATDIEAYEMVDRK